MSEQGFPINSRFRILANPVIHPGKCAVCGAVDRPVVDFDTTVPMYGAILVCFSCVQEAARGVGMVSRVELDIAQENLAQTLEEQLNHANMIGVSRERYDDIVVAVSSLSDALLFGSSSNPTVVAGSYRKDASSLPIDDATHDTDTEGLPERDAGSSKQDDNLVVSERSASISSGSKHGSPRSI